MKIKKLHARKVSMATSDATFVRTKLGKSHARMDSAAISGTTFVHYYEKHQTREELMGFSVAQSELIFYLFQVLDWLYRSEGWLITSKHDIYRRRNRYEYPLTPHLGLFKGVVLTNPADRRISSWRLYEPNRPAPQVVFQFSVDETWEDDLYKKPRRYAAIGVREYYAYDPHDPPYWPTTLGRLRGWWNVDGNMVEQPLDAHGRVWSAELASWLVPDGGWLRLVDREGQRRLTGQEAERAETEAIRAQTEVHRAQTEVLRVERKAIQAGTEAEPAAKETALAKLEAARAAKETAWAKLRELGIDPEQL